MERVILDTGALIVAERDQRRLLTRIWTDTIDDIDVFTSSACIAEVWRDPSRQVNLVRFLRKIDEQPLDPDTARAAGELMGAADTDQMVDAAVALLTMDGDHVLTSDPDDIGHLLAVRGVRAAVDRV